MTPTDHPSPLRAPTWSRWIALALALAMGVVFYLSASPHSHHEIHPDCDAPEHSCVVTQWSGGLTLAAFPIGLPAVIWVQEAQIFSETPGRPRCGAPAWTWSQAPPPALA